jgi:hypothetical protein
MRDVRPLPLRPVLSTLTKGQIERHPHVLHLPAPHVWSPAPGGPLVCTLELHVPRDTDDAGVLALTRWARERVAGALRAGRGEGAHGAEVTVGVVRG